MEVNSTDDYYFNYRFHQKENPKIIIRNEDLAKVRQFTVEVVTNNTGFSTATNNIAFTEDHEQEYKVNIKESLHFKFNIKVLSQLSFSNRLT